MRTYQPFILTGILSIGFALLISYCIWGPAKRQLYLMRNDPGLVEAAKKGRDAVVFIYSLTSDTASYMDAHQTGSGVIISEDGYIVTNHHVISGGLQIFVQLNDKREYDAELVASDSTHDVALLRIKAKALPFLEFGNSDSLRVGEQVLAVGNPYRLQSTVTSGIISAKDRDIKLADNATRNFIQTDVPINLGNSGGALLDASGKLMGLNTAMISVSGEYEGFSFAMPSNLVKKITEDLREFGSLQRASIAMTIRPVTQNVAAEASMSRIYGVVVDAFTLGSAADSAGIHSLDIILSVDGKDVLSSADFLSMLALHRPGDVLALDILRNGKMEKLHLRLERKKE